MEFSFSETQQSKQQANNKRSNDHHTSDNICCIRSGKIPVYINWKNKYIQFTPAQILPESKNI